MITDRIGRHEVLLSINHKNYNFREKKNSQVMKERENLHYNTDKGGVHCLIILFKLIVKVPVVGNTAVTPNPPGLLPF